MACLRKNGVYKQTTEAFDAFMQGNTDATHSIAYKEHLLLEPVKCIAESVLTLTAKEWIHLNAWEWKYEMRLSEAKVQQLILRHHGEYHRCIRAWIKNLQYRSYHDKWSLLGDMLWGHGAMMDVVDEENGERIINNLLYVVEDSYQLLREAKKDIDDPDKVSFETFCDEIFGNG